MPRLEDVVADLRERVTYLRLEGHPVQAGSVERAVEEAFTALDRGSDKQDASGVVGTEPGEMEGGE